MQLPRLSSYDDTPIHNTRAAVNLTQVEAPRLRAWERRYAILSPHRSSNSYRLYSERDLAIIRWLREQVEAGMTISQATSYLKSFAGAGPPITQPPAEIPSLKLEVMVQSLVGAALRLDEPEATHLLRQAFAVYCVEEVCEVLVQPTLYAIGAAWSEGRDVIVAEHFISNIVRVQLDTIWRMTFQPDNGPQVLVACVPGEQHELGAFMLALFLRRRGLCVTYLGQNTEAPALVRTVQCMRPAAVCLSATMPEHRAQLVDLARAAQAISDAHIFIGGQALESGTNGKPLPPRIIALHVAGTEAAKQIKKALTQA